MWVEDPFLVERLRTEPAVAQVLDWYDRIDVLVTGIGSWNLPVSCLHNAFSETWRRQVLAGGVRAADERYMLDYWGLAFKQAADELRAKLQEKADVAPSNRRWRIAVCGPQRPAQVELGPDFVTQGDPGGADFAMMLGEFYCLKLNAPVVVEVERDGVIFARVYDIRGRSIRSLLTLPAP